jgi:uncharacterized RDD family membrane protein YckC
MSNPEAGWYDDPWSAEQYRYWDGDAWTHHAAPKHLPPQQAVPTPTTATSYGSNPYGPYGNASTGGNAYTGSPYSGAPYAGHAQPGPQLAPGTAGPYPADWRPTFGPTTPDGVPLSGWWRRVGAWVLDELIVAVMALPLAGYFWYQATSEFATYMGDTIDADQAGRSTSSVPVPDDLQLHVMAATLISALIGVVYQVIMLRRSGATWGKQAAGIRVRLREREGQLSYPTIARRIGFVAALILLSTIPVIGIVFGLARLLDYLWPLWDSKNQALHDKVAATNVVRTR